MNVLSICSDDELEPADGGDAEDADIDGKALLPLPSNLSPVRLLIMHPVLLFSDIMPSLYDGKSCRIWSCVNFYKATRISSRKFQQHGQFFWHDVIRADSVVDLWVEGEGQIEY